MDVLHGCFCAELDEHFVDRNSVSCLNTAFSLRLMQSGGKDNVSNA